MGMINPELAKALQAERDSPPVWMQVPQYAVIDDPNRRHAYEYILAEFIPRVEQTGARLEFVACPGTDTINLVFPSAYLLGWTEAFAAAGFREKTIPTQDLDAEVSAELRAALLGGGEFKDGWR